MIETNYPMRRIRIIIISIDDKLYLPKVFQPLFKDTSFEVLAVFLIPTTSAINMHPGGSLGLAAVFKRFQLYGATAFLKLSIMYLAAFCRLIIDPHKKLKSLATAQRIPVINWRRSVNDSNLIQMIKELKPDMLLGIFSEKADNNLISSTPKGLMLLHYSLLPHFAGREPTFWTLLEDPQKAGITFFKATDRLDAGTVLIQAGRSLADVKSLHEAIDILSDTASQHIISAAHRLFKGIETQDYLPKKNILKPWPCKQDRVKFIQKGLRFI